MSKFDKTCESCGEEFSSFIETVCDDCHDEMEKERVAEFEKLKKENNNLRKIIAKEVSENDEFGSEFVIAQILREEKRVLIEKLNHARAFIRRFIERVEYDWSSQAVEAMEKSEFKDENN
jgi:hypothetical protein